MERPSEEIETVPDSLEDIAPRAKSFAGIVGNFFRKKGQPIPQVAPVIDASHRPESDFMYEK